jgi:F-type H+-transporting ATPase subunit b
MAEQRRELEEMHKKAETEHEKLRKELAVKAEQEATRILNEAREAAFQEKSEIMKSLEEEVGKNAVLIVSHILKKEMTEQRQKELLQEALEALKKKSYARIPSGSS